jgi:hypothetical protein
MVSILDLHRAKPVEDTVPPDPDVMLRHRPMTHQTQMHLVPDESTLADAAAPATAQKMMHLCRGTLTVWEFAPTTGPLAHRGGVPLV